MKAFESGALWTVGVLVAAVVGAMFLHIIARVLTGSREDRQTELDSLVLSSLQSGASAGDVAQRIRRSPRPITRRSLVHALKTLGEPYFAHISAVYDQLRFDADALRQLRSWSWIRRAEAALELGAMRLLDAAQECMRMLGDRRPEVRMAAARALSDMAAPNALRPILESIPVCTRWAISETVELVHGFGETAAPELQATLTNSQSRQARLAAIEGLGELGHAESFPAIERLLADSELETRIYAARAIGRIGGPGSVEALGRALKDPAWEVRAVAARGLGASRDPQALPLLQAALTDPSWWVRLNAGEALAGQEAQGADTLRQALNSSDTFARDMAAQMLEKLQPRGAS